ncbi:hypothetical protein J2R96_002002 [Bradyrhizobium elkanii]|nr:hypothetical protein [Bradyrhizobium elkanii]
MKKSRFLLLAVVYSLPMFAQTDDLFLTAMNKAGEAEVAKASTSRSIVVSPSEEMKSFMPADLRADGLLAIVGLAAVTC